MKNGELIFIYNADMNLFSLISDFARMLITPSSYECSLCMLTYDYIVKKRKWKNFLDSIPYKKKFYLRNELKKANIKYNGSFPVILLKNENELLTLISTEELNHFQDLDALISALKEKVDSL